MQLVRREQNNCWPLMFPQNPITNCVVPFLTVDALAVHLPSGMTALGSLT